MTNTLKNKPSDLTIGFRMDVIQKTPGRGLQIIFSNEPDTIYIRGFVNDTLRFESWKKLSITSC